MRVKTVKAKNGSVSYSIIQDIYKENGKRSTQIVRNLGNDAKIRRENPGVDPMAFALNIAKQLTDEANQGKKTIISQFDETSLIPLNNPLTVSTGHLFIDKIFYELKLDKLCRQITKDSKITFNLTEVLKTLISSRILSPGSKLNAHQFSQQYLFAPDLELQHFYRGLDLLADHFEAIQTHAYKKSATIVPRDTSILYYDCSNFYFEIEEEDDLRRYGKSKEHRPNPIVQMGLFLDGDGLPLAFDLFPGNRNEMPTLKPLETKVIRDFNVSDVIVCTDAGLASFDNKKFNNTKRRSYVTTHSLLKSSLALKNWALEDCNWYLAGIPNTHKYYGHNFSLQAVYEAYANHLEGQASQYDDLDLLNAIFYKEKWEPIKQTKSEKANKKAALEEHYFVTHSIKYANYQRSIREAQIERAMKKMRGKDPQKSTNPNDPRRFIKRTSVTENGELATDHYTLDAAVIEKEAMFDGYYCVATNLDAGVEKIVKINRQRWEIEESFRLMKTDLRARPVYLSRENRIKAHFLTCFLALLHYRILERRLKEQYTAPQIIHTLRQMQMRHYDNGTYLPNSTRTEITDALHEALGFRTDYQILSKSMIRSLKKTIQSGHSTQNT